MLPASSLVVLNDKQASGVSDDSVNFSSSQREYQNRQVGRGDAADAGGLVDRLRADP